MSELKVGIKQIGKPTPPVLKTIFKTLLYMTGAWAVVSTQLKGVDDAIIASIDHWSLITLSLYRFTISFFHFEEEQ